VDSVKARLESGPVEGSAPCRIDCGGTLDIRTLSDPLKDLAPCTFNMALDMKTRVRLFPHRSGRIQVSSAGVGREEQSVGQMSFGGPLGLIFAIADHFRIDGVHIEIESESPPRSALGGSSTAAVSLIGALSRVVSAEGAPQMGKEQIVLLAHAIEEAVAGVACGLQDHLAAVYGGVHAWHWPREPEEPRFQGRELLKQEDYPELEAALLVAYCGVPHVSHDINKRWIDQFLRGETRALWPRIVSSTAAFVDAMKKKDWRGAAAAMNQEVDIRIQMTPDVFDDVGIALVEAARALGCGARFTGAGGGGCIWALGEERQVRALQPAWRDVVSVRQGAKLLDARVSPKGLQVA
jgi:D-glycero-alpha-D-manno-heptose-7-phosphate kinase